MGTRQVTVTLTAIQVDLRDERADAVFNVRHEFRSDLEKLWRLSHSTI